MTQRTGFRLRMDESLGRKKTNQFRGSNYRYNHSDLFDAIFLTAPSPPFHSSSFPFSVFHVPCVCGLRVCLSPCTNTDKLKRKPIFEMCGSRKGLSLLKTQVLPPPLSMSQRGWTDICAALINEWSPLLSHPIIP